ncbi:MAG TPA: hypothetical protein VF060_08015 [Trebonia sp.]
MDLSGCRTCRTCRGPVLPGYAICYQCDQATRIAGGLLADAVAPISYAVKGGDLARDLWLYKSGLDGAVESASRICTTLSEYLDEHGASVWRAAGMPDGPGAVAVVPSGQGRLGDHPLLAIAEAATGLPVISLMVRPGCAAHGRYVSTGWLRVGGRVSSADVLLVEDSWVSGASAQSAAAALKLAGAARVAALVIGRHVDPGDPRSRELVRALSA